MQADNELSALARSRQAQMLPGLLAAVRWRRRRRVVGRTAAAAAVVLVAAAVLWRLPSGGGGAPDDVGGLVEIAAGTGGAGLDYAVVRDEPGVVARYAVASSAHDDWYVDDAGLQAFLRQDERPAGLVRVGARVTLASAAIDPFPQAGSE